MGTHFTHLTACRCAVALMLVVCASPFTSASAYAVEWGSDKDSVRKDDLGSFQGDRLGVEIRTQFDTLHSSHVKVTLNWYDKWAGEDVKQVLFEDTRAARIEDYKFTLDRGKATVYIDYLCPKSRKDTTTTCKEQWEWKKNSRRFKLEGKKSSDPLAKTGDEIAKLLKRKKFDQAKKELEKAQKELGEDKLDNEELFGLFWGGIIDAAYDDYRNGRKKKAVERIQGFLKDPPITSSEQCPEKDVAVVCLGEKALCGCSDKFGQVRYSDRWDKRYSKLAKMLGKLDEHELAERLLVPALGLFPQNTDVMLTLADMYWATERDYKARPLYAKVRKIRMADKTYIPNRVYDRFKEK